MKKILFSLALLGLTGLALAQNKGIKFENGLSWEQIKAKAKAEHKYIFMDVFATWCGPCKAMDKDVYLTEKAGEMLNGKFISIKVQTDKTNDDNVDVKNWYAIAEEIMTTYKINAYPSLLFFSPEGNLVHKAIGYRDVNGFITLVSEAQDPSKQYCALIAQYNRGDKNYRAMPELAKMARSFNEMEVYKKIVKDYEVHLKQLSDKELFTQSNLLFITDNGLKICSDDRIFQLIKEHPVEADSLVHNALYAKQVISWVINNEEIIPILYQDNKPIANTPDWDQFRSKIKVKYAGKYADTLVSQAQFLFYSIKNDWKTYAICAEKAMKAHPPKANGNSFSIATGGYALRGPGDDAWALNSNAWSIFENSNDPLLLKKALAWSELSIKITSDTATELHQYYDTKANLLYKMGNVEKATKYEKLALGAAKYAQKGFEEIFAKGYVKTLDKIKKGLPTWSTPVNN